MTLATVFGPLIDRAAIAGDVMDTILAWHDTYLVAVEQANDEAPRTWDRPADWRTQPETAAPRIEDVLPLLVVATNGEAADPIDEGDGTISSRWTIIADLYLRGSTAAEMETGTGRHGAAIAALLDHKAGDPDTGLKLSQLASRPRQTFIDVGSVGDDALGCARVTFTVQVDELRNRWGGPDEPFPAPRSSHIHDRRPAMDYRNTSDHGFAPVGGHPLAPGEDGPADPKDPTVKALIAEGHLTKIDEPAKPAKEGSK
jgi:hypothetical protein